MRVSKNLYRILSFFTMAQRDAEQALHGLQSPFEFPSIRGGVKIAFQGYCYVKEKTLKNGNISYKCDYPNRQCKGRLTTDAENKVLSQQDHNMHAPDQTAVEVKINQARFKKTAAEHSATPLSALLNAETAKIHQEIQGYMPSDNAMKRSGQRIRRKDFPPEPTGPQDVVFEANWCKVNGDDWVLHQDASDENPCIVLATKANLRYLKQSSVWYGDGTFDVSPKMFYQMYTIHCPVMGKVLPMVYCLMSNKTADSYRKVFNILNTNMANGALVNKFRADLEKAPIMQFLDVFPNSEVETCFFHFAQANWRQIQRLGLSPLYLENFEVRRAVKSFTALAFVPPEDDTKFFKL